MPDPITESLPYHTDEVPTGVQDAWHCVVHLLIPHTDTHGNPVDTEAHAQDYVSETLRGKFLDWGYFLVPDLDFDGTDLGTGEKQSPIKIVVSDPYVEGTFLDEWVLSDG